MKPNSHTLQNSAPSQRVHRFIVPGNCENCNLSTSGGYQMVEDCLNTNQTAIKRKEGRKILREEGRKENIQAGKKGRRKGCREMNGGSEGGEEREREKEGEREISYPQGNKSPELLQVELREMSALIRAGWPQGRGGKERAKKQKSHGWLSSKTLGEARPHRSQANLGNNPSSSSPGLITALRILWAAVILPADIPESPCQYPAVPASSTTACPYYAAPRMRFWLTFNLRQLYSHHQSEAGRERGRQGGRRRGEGKKRLRQKANTSKGQKNQRGSNGKGHLSIRSVSALLWVADGRGYFCRSGLNCGEEAEEEEEDCRLGLFMSAIAREGGREGRQERERRKKDEREGKEGRGRKWE
ncbi:hypothetical protein L345_11178, partial [Ophiophagus hannah]